MKFRSLFGFILGSAISSTTLAGADSCEDLSFRLYRADLAPGGIKIHNVKSAEFGDHQLAEVYIKNVGTIQNGPSSNGQDFNTAPIRSRIAGYVVDSHIDLPVAVGESKKVYFRLPAGAIKHCQVVEVKIDLNKTAKQKGCDCFMNDAKDLRAVHVGKPSCRMVSDSAFQDDVDFE